MPTEINGFTFPDTVDTLNPAERSILQVPINLPTSYLSTSQIELYLSCPTKYKIRYVNQKKGGDVPALEEGSAMHAVMERNNKHKIKTGNDMSTKLLEGVHEQEVRDRWKKFPGQEGDVDEILARGRSMIRSYMLTFAPKFTPVHVERKIGGYIGPVPVVGVIDTEGQLQTPGIKGNGRSVVVDYKTVKRKKSQAELEDSLQLSLYAYFKRREIVGKKFDLSVGYLNFLKEKGTAEWQSVDANMDRIMWMRRVVLSVANAISMQCFPLTSPVNWGCSKDYCDHWNECRGFVCK